MRRIVLLLGLLLPVVAWGRETNLVRNPGFEEGDPSSGPAAYVLEGGAAWRKTGNPDETGTLGVVLPSGQDGSVSQTVSGLDPAKGKWITFAFRALPDDGLAVGDGTLSMRIEFFSRGGAMARDGIAKELDREVEADRRDFAKNGGRGKGGGAVWRTYSLEELLPFADVDTVRITVARKGGGGSGAFQVDDFSLVQRAASRTGRVDPADARRMGAVSAGPVDPAKLTALGGRWYYFAAPGEALSPLTVTEANADRLYYKADRFVAPFAGAMASALRVGWKDKAGNTATAERPVPDNVVVTFKGDGFLTLRTKNLPNHPTSVFPEINGGRGGNPSSIQEQDYTFRLPLDPQPDPDAKAMTANDGNRALPMGPIGVAVNGVVFFNPFDAGMTDATGLMDRCCGHPNQENAYHYHKYPVCVNTAFVDKGEDHSEIIGFAFDGLPLYGPYERAGVMAKDDAENPLNDFNAHYDAQRGWHYHVTPGKYPYLLGGYFAKVEGSNLARGPRGGGTGGGPGRSPGPGAEGRPSGDPMGFGPNGPPPGWGPPPPR
ncbi:MAG TPA: YHYH protein [Candidatus Methylacidiphilales bacterium]